MHRTFDRSTHAAGYTNSGVAAALGVTLAALAWPALAAVPYLLLVLFGLLRWSGGREHRRSSPEGCRALQLYISAYHSVVLLFLMVSPPSEYVRRHDMACICNNVYNGLLLLLAGPAEIDLWFTPSMQL